MFQTWNSMMPHASFVLGYVGVDERWNVWWCWYVYEREVELSPLCGVMIQTVLPPHLAAAEETVVVDCRILVGAMEYLSSFLLGG